MWQWADCVGQLLRLYPRAFEFSSVCEPSSSFDRSFSEFHLFYIATVFGLLLWMVVQMKKHYVVVSSMLDFLSGKLCLDCCDRFFLWNLLIWSSPAGLVISSAISKSLPLAITFIGRWLLLKTCGIGKSFSLPTVLQFRLWLKHQQLLFTVSLGLLSSMQVKFRHFKYLKAV